MRLVDTAGLRKRAKVDDKLERLSAADTRRAIDYAEVVVLLLDATRGLEAQDLRIAAQVIEEGRALIIALNKWDVAEHASSLFNGVKAALGEGLAQLKDVPLLTVSAKTGKGIDTILKVAFELREAWSRRVPTGELNRWFEQAVEANPPPAPKGQRIKLRYITQVKSRPPTFVVFGNRTDELPESYRRYLRQRHAARPRLRPGAAAARLPRPQNPFDKGRGAKANFTLCGLSAAAVDHSRHCPAIEEQAVTDEARDIVDWAHFEKSRTELGPAFIRILSYFKEDGVKSIAQIEQAMHEQNTIALVLPAHTLKGELRQLGAEPIAKIAELIETTARFCVEIATDFPTNSCPKSSNCGRCSTRPSSCSTRRPTRWSSAPRRPASAARSATRVRSDLISGAPEITPRNQGGRPMPTSTICANSCVPIPSSDLGGHAAGKRSGTTIKFITTYVTSP